MNQRFKKFKPLSKLAFQVMQSLPPLTEDRPVGAKLDDLTADFFPKMFLAPARRRIYRAIKEINVKGPTEGGCLTVAATTIRPRAWAIRPFAAKWVDRQDRTRKR